MCLISQTFTLCQLGPQRMVFNWKSGHHSLTRIECHSENSKGVYCLQYDDKKIVSGLRDNTIKVRIKGLTSHTQHIATCFVLYCLCAWTVTSQ